MGKAVVYRRSPLPCAVELLWLLIVILPGVRAERLPVKTYTTADGLLRDEVNRIRQDSRGFLWFCTNDGLSRFDGYGFTNYTTDDGLPHRVVNDLLETRGGEIWIATGHGLVHFNPKGRRGPFETSSDPEVSMFFPYLPDGGEVSKRITVLKEDAQGRIWCGTEDGLFRFEAREGGKFLPIDLPKEGQGLQYVSAIIQDRHGDLWVGMDMGQGLNRVLSDGRVEHYATRQNSRESRSIKTLLETKGGEIWAGMSDSGLCSLAAEPDPQRPIFSRCLTKKDGLPNLWVDSLYQTADGKLWVGTSNGIYSFAPGSSAPPQARIYGEAKGLCNEMTRSLCEDKDGNLWIATGCGLKRIVRSNFIRYTEVDGLASQTVNSIFVSHTGELFVITKQTVESRDKKSLSAVHIINRFNGNRFTSVKPNVPSGAGTGWGGGQVVVQDLAGRW